jgi:hypothetical protein
MDSQRNYSDRLRQNLLQHLTRIDRVLTSLVPIGVDLPDVDSDEPWLVPLFEKRRGLQMTLCEVERQIERYRA